MNFKTICVQKSVKNFAFAQEQSEPAGMLVSVQGEGVSLFPGWKKKIQSNLPHLANVFV